MERACVYLLVLGTQQMGVGWVISVCKGPSSVELWRHKWEGRQQMAFEFEMALGQSLLPATASLVAPGTKFQAAGGHPGHIPAEDSPRQ